MRTTEKKRARTLEERIAFSTRQVAEMTAEIDDLAARLHALRRRRCREAYKLRVYTGTVKHRVKSDKPPRPVEERMAERRLAAPPPAQLWPVVTGEFAVEGDDRPY